MTPMIDMVFLLLVFFMVSAKPVQPERDIPMGLPGQVAQAEVVDIPDEARVIIEPSGQVVLNERNLDTPGSSALPELRAAPAARRCPQRLRRGGNPGSQPRGRRWG